MSLLHALQKYCMMVEYNYNFHMREGYSKVSYEEAKDARQSGNRTKVKDEKHLTEKE